MYLGATKYGLALTSAVAVVGAVVVGDPAIGLDTRVPGES